MKISYKSTLSVVGIVAAALSVTLVCIYCSKVIPNNKSNIIPVLFGIVLLSGVAIACLVIICCCKNSLLDVDDERISINSNRNGYVSIDSDNASIGSHDQYLDVNDQIKKDFENVIYKFNYLLSNIERCDVQNVGGSQFRFGNVKTVFFFPVFKNNFDVMLNNLLSKGLLTEHAVNDQRIVNELNPEDYSFVCIAAKLIMNTSLCEVYPLWVRNCIKVLAVLPINDIGMVQRRLTCDKIISLLGQRVYFANSYKDLGEKFAELMNSIKVHGIRTVEDLYKIWDNPKLAQYVDQLSQLRYFRYYNFFGVDCDQAKADLAFQILDSYLINGGMPLEVASKYADAVQKLESAKLAKERTKQDTREMASGIELTTMELNKIKAGKLVAEYAVDHINRTTISWVGSSLNANLVDVQFTKNCTSDLIRRVASTARPFEVSSAMRVGDRTQAINSSYPESSVAAGIPKASASSRMMARSVVGHSSTMYGSSSAQASTSGYTLGVLSGGDQANADTAGPFEFSSAMSVGDRTQAINSSYPESSVATGIPKIDTSGRKQSKPITKASSTTHVDSRTRASSSIASSVTGIPKASAGSRMMSRPVAQILCTTHVGSRATAGSSSCTASSVATDRPKIDTSGRK
ncbi:hypothetical protein [Ehrlichia canis]|uniref:hypothetical protein n=1 Tax=Ehrlichia canis TaxID=944 RepID=UPI001F1ED7EC|nr:hypothetical protein [Ehrlichia canis]UKC53047.1 hypothetical protein s20019040002_000089 [Ehrlichia canis]UKC53984.1 hypothetical protein s20026770001_000089 [Ehrlichia canis]UKC54920.1 hypothetical protein s21009500007_000089 [Ehrlichia canis]